MTRMSSLSDLPSRHERMMNPPWWDLLGRQANWNLRCDKAYVVGDAFAVKWMRWLLPVRLVAALALTLVPPFYWGEGTARWVSLVPACLAPLAVTWAMERARRASLYEQAYRDGQFGALVIYID